MLAPSDVDVTSDVRRVDKDRIVEFARLNAEKQELMDDMKRATQTVDDLENAETEAMMAADEEEGLLVVLGSSFATASEDAVSELIEQRKEVAEAEVARLKAKIADVVAAQEELKGHLYSRFGRAIDLEV